MIDEKFYFLPDTGAAKLLFKNKLNSNKNFSVFYT